MRRVWWVIVLCLSGGAGVSVSAQRPDLKAAQTAIMKADEDFNQSVADRNREKFLSLVADDATFGGGTGNEQRGKDAIYTTGFSKRRAPNGAVNKGNYLTVWKKQKDGSWKAIFDTGTGVPTP